MLELLVIWGNDGKEGGEEKRRQEKNRTERTADFGIVIPSSKGLRGITA
jgi:hypothetical protein